jgi:nicotinate-nucleotide adenylyltransferase
MPAAAIGLLGGSFDPIHAGHLQLARDALAHLPLSEVRFMPAAQPWQKGGLTAAADRAHMVELAIARAPGCVLDMHEIERGGTTYTVDTLRALRAADATRDAPLVLIMGSDQFERFDTWREWRAIVDLAHVAVAQRAGVSPTLGPALAAVRLQRRCAPAGLSTRAAGCITEFTMTPVAASATEIRRLLKTAGPDADRRLAEIVPAAVLDYIRAHHLYA